MFTRTSLVLAVALMFVTPALAQNSFQGFGHAPQWSGSAPVSAGKIHRRAPAMTRNWTNGAGAAFGLATPGRSVSRSSEHIFVGGIDQGTDPDPQVRMQLQRDPPYGG